MPPQHKPADDVRVRDGVESDFRQRYRRDQARAERAWKSLVGKRPALLRDQDFGEPFNPPRLPQWLRGLSPMYVVKGLPDGFRAVYSVQRVPGAGLVVIVEWVGDHKEYDRLFGYVTS